jgi:DNA-binding NtrC family response regulator
MSTKVKVLVVDDERLIADSLVDILREFGFDASCRYSALEAIDLAVTDPFDVLITDVFLVGMNGIDSAIEIRKILPNCKVLLLSGNPRTVEMLKDANEAGHNFEILAKPLHPTEIIDWVKSMTIGN